MADPRHDHSLRIPWPDRTVSQGLPNACNQCHTDRSSQWAADAVTAWHPQPKPGFQPFAEAFATTGPGAPVNLADVHRSRGAESDAESTLRAALARDPRLAPAHLALGLSLARQRRGDEALKSFAQAAALAPDNARFAYVHAVAPNDAGQRRPALRKLQRGLTRQPDDPDLLLTAALFERDTGNRPAALDHARRLQALEPGNRDAQQLVRDLATGTR